MNRTGHQRFWRIFGLSIVLHGAIFALMQSPWSKVVKPLPAIVASFRPMVVAAASPAKPQAVQRVDTREPKPAPVARRPVMVSEARQSLVKVAPVEKITAPKTEAVANSPAPMPAVAAVSAAAPATDVPPPAVRPVRAQADALASYRQRLSELFAGRQAYPRMAAMRGWEGEVRLRLKVARKGNLVSIALDHSSGFEVLDQNALAMVEGIAALPELPEALGDNEIQIVVPINYKLRKTT